KGKRSESGMIQDPVTMDVNATVGEALQLMKEHSIVGIPDVSSTGKLVGIVTNRDLRFEKNMKRPIPQVMTSEKLVTTQDGTDLAKAEEILQQHKIEKLPVVDGPGNRVGL